MMNKTLLVADDHPLFRESIVRLVREMALFDKVYEAGNGVEVMEVCKMHRVHMVLLDVKMPVMDGVEAARYLLGMPLSVRPNILMLSIYSDPMLIYNLLDIGVHGYLNKNCELDELHLAIRSVLKGELCFPKKFDDSIKEIIHHKHKPLMRLSGDEDTLLKLLADGKINKEIATIMNYSVRTVEAKRLRLEKKMRVKNTAELISFAFRVGLLSLAE